MKKGKYDFALFQYKIDFTDTAKYWDLLFVDLRYGLLNVPGFFSSFIVLLETSQTHYPFFFYNFTVANAELLFQRLVS